MFKSLVLAPVGTGLGMLFASLPLHAQCPNPCFGTPGGTMVPAGLYANQAWCLANSPYHVTGSITVGGLCIEAGVEVLVDPGFQIDVALTIDAQGTEADPILFDESTPGMSWAGFRFQNAPSGSILRYCQIRNSDSSALEILDGAPPVLEDCLIEQNANLGGSQLGGGIDATFSAANPANLIFRNCRFIGNWSRDHGGAIHATMGTGLLELENCTLEENRANPSNVPDNSVAGGAVYLVGDGDFKNCTFRDNSSRANATSTGIAYGGAVYVSGDLSLANCTIRDNAATTGSADCCNTRYAYGGGVSAFTGDLTITNCVIACNTTSASHRSWGAVYIDTPGTALIDNSTLAWNNVAAIHAQSGTVNLTNSITYFNNGSGVQIGGAVAVSQAYSDIQNGTMTGSNGNIDVSPFFVSGSVESCTACDLKIILGSPCMDAGDPSPAKNDGCHPPAPGSAPGNSRNDMGAHGGPGNCNWGVGAHPYTYCQSAANSVAAEGALITYSGSTSVGANNLTLMARPVPNQPGIFFYGAHALAGTPFGSGFLCIDGMIFRLPVAIATSNQLSYTIDNTMLAPAGQFDPGCTWRFQAWYRDPTGPGGSTFNLSDALCVTFEP